MQIVAMHLIFYMIIFLIITIWVGQLLFRGTGFSTFLGLWLWNTHYTSPAVRNITLFVIVVIVFPIASIYLEIDRRKRERKKNKNDSKHEMKLDH
jgi:hypothetical protein